LLRVIIAQQINVVRQRPGDKGFDAQRHKLEGSKDATVHIGESVLCERL
jgi:hypothetical protein